MTTQRKNVLPDEKNSVYVRVFDETRGGTRYHRYHHSRCGSENAESIKTSAAVFRRIRRNFFEIIGRIIP